jgi:hypothetical protein
MPSDRDILTMVVIGWIRELRQDLRRKVGMVSRVQDALDDMRMACRTSSELAGEKLSSLGGGKSGAICGEEFVLLGREEHSLVIFWSKNWRKELASEEGEMKLGSTGGQFRESRESRVDHNFFGCVAH